jgi:hypothetical protein
MGELLGYRLYLPNSGTTIPGGRPMTVTAPRSGRWSLMFEDRAAESAQCGQTESRPGSQVVARAGSAGDAESAPI